MYFVTFYVYSRQRPNRTYVFAGAATYAGSLVDGGNVRRHVVLRVGGHHLDGTHGTMTLAVAALVLALCRDAFTDCHYSVTNLNARLLSLVDGLHRQTDTQA